MGLKKYDKIYIPISKFIISVVILAVGGFFSLIALAGPHASHTPFEITFGCIVGLLTLVFVIAIWIPARPKKNT